MDYEAIIGLEVHVQLKTRRKIFARAPHLYGEEPNTLLDPVVLALPGTLPVMNKAALDHMILMGLLFDCTIAESCKWDRKNYWYPDSPKNYQISQYDQPLCLGGSVEVELPGPNRATMGEHKSIPLTRIHLEEDPGKLTHFAEYSLIDDNRTGTPLAEIVTDPALRSADEAVAFLKAVRLNLVYAGISDCDMEKGQMRCDANVSLRPQGSTVLNIRTEMKNLNSFSAVKAAIESEIRRQAKLYREDRSAEIIQETRRWNADKGYTVSLRGKEEAHDYRYFPDPDLMPVKVDEDWKKQLSARLPERPYDRQRRYMEELGLPYSAATVLIQNSSTAAFFEETYQLCGKAKEAANFIVNDLAKAVARQKREEPEEESLLELSGTAISPRHLAELVQLIDSGKLSKQMGQDLFPEMLTSGKMPAELAKDKGLEQTSDEGELEAICATAIEADPAAVEKFRSGNEKAINAFKGPVMKATRGKANPRKVDEILRRLLGD